MAVTLSPIGVCIFPEPPLNGSRTVSYSSYLTEVLSHAGMCCEWIQLDGLMHRLDSLKLLITLGEHSIDQGLRGRLGEWVARGGVWVSIGGLLGLDDVFGARVRPPDYKGWGAGLRSLGEGYLQPQKQHPILGSIVAPVHFFGGMVAEPTTGEVFATAASKHGRPSDFPCIVTNSFGNGRTVFIAVDLTGSIVRIQQGIGVTRDGVASCDGTGPLDDGVLKSGDGGVLDWEFDREPVPGVSHYDAYLRPIADQWREVLLRSVFYLAETANIPVALLWLYPRDLPSIGHVSHDTDGNDPQKARVLLDSLKRCGIQSTWCVIAPGYPSEIIDEIRSAGHELAMHYDAMTPGLDWGETQFESQWAVLRALLGRLPVTNKNHYLRWEGDLEWFAWLERRGIEMDQTKGPSKPGEAGFNFGTSHPHFPMTFGGQQVNVLELPTLAQDLAVFAPPALGDVLLDRVIAHHGVAHFLFHPSHTHKPEVSAAMEAVVEKGRQRGLEWWTAEQINAWSRARRQVRWSVVGTGDGVELSSAAELKDATVLVLRGERSRIAVDGEVAESGRSRRWGFDFRTAVLDLSPGQTCSITSEITAKD